MHLIAFTCLLSVSLQPPLPAAFPGPPGHRSRGHAALGALEVLFGCPSARRASAPTSSLDLKGLLSRCHPGARRGLLGSRPDIPYRAVLHRHSAGSTLPRLWPTDSSRVAPRLRPGTSPQPFRFHLAVDTLPSGCLPAVRQRSSFLGCFHRFRLRARLGFRLSAHPGQ